MELRGIFSSMIKETSGVIMKLLILLFLTNIAHATYDPSLQNLQLDMMYSANVVTTIGTVTLENKDFISGNCSAANPTVCTFTSGIFTVAPNCVAAQTNAGGSTVLANIASVSSSSVSVRTINSSTGADSGSIPFNLICQKQGVDYLTASSAVYSVQNQDTDWVSYSPSVSSVGVATNLGKWRRQGDTLEVEGQITFNAGGSASTLTIGMPSGLTIDSAKITSSSTGTVGSGYWSDSGVGFFLLNVRPDTSSTIAFYQQAGTASFNSSVIATGDVVTFNFKVPVTGWKTAPFAIASIAGYGSAPGVAGSANQSVDSFTVSYGTTAATTVCSASPCSYLDQIGTAVTSVTRSATGVYSLNTARTYAKLKCSSNSVGSAYTVNSSINCSSCNAVTFATVLSTTGANTDTYGTLYCQGNY